MDPFPNLGVKLRGCLCGPAESGIRLASRPGGIFLDLGKTPSFMNWKPVVPVIELLDGH